MKSRFALESNIFPDLILLGVLLLLLWIIKGKKLAFYFSASVLGLSAYAYGTAYFFLPIFCVGIYIYLIITKNATFWHFLQYVSIIFIVSLPIIVFVIINRLDGNSIEIFGITIPKLFFNREASILNFDAGFLQTISTNFRMGMGILINQEDGIPCNSLPFFGTTFVWFLPFWILGIIVSFFKKNKVDKIFFVWFFTAFLSMLVMETNINRLNIIWIPMIYFTFNAFIFIIEKIPKATSAVVGTVLVLGACFIFTFFGSANQNLQAYYFNDGLLDAIEYVQTSDAEQITVTNEINQPYISVLFQTKISPKEYLESRVLYEGFDDFQQILKLGKYSFEAINMKNLKTYQSYVTSIYDLTDDVKNDSRLKITYFSYFIVIEKAGRKKYFSKFPDTICTCSLLIEYNKFI